MLLKGIFSVMKLQFGESAALNIKPAKVIHKRMKIHFQQNNSKY